MGSRLHGNDGGRRRTPHGRTAAHPHRHSPRRRESTAGGACDGFPSTRERRWEAAHLHTVGRRRAHIVIPATAGGGAPTSSFPRRRAAARPHRHSRDGGNPRRGEPAMGSRLHGNDGGRRRTHTVGRQRTHIVISRDGGNPRRGETGMGSRLHGNDGRRWRTPHGRRQCTHIVIPATAGIHGGGSLRWVPVYTGTTVGDGAPHTVGRQRAHIVIPRDGGRRLTHIVIPATAGIHGGGRQGWVPVYTGTTAGDGAPHTVGDGAPHTVGGSAPTSSFPATVGGGAPTSSFPRRRESTWGGEPAMGSRLHGNDGRAAARPTR